MDQLLNLFQDFTENELNNEQACLVLGGAAPGTCDGSNCCQETAGGDTTTDDVCTGDKCDADDGPDHCV